MGSEQKRIIEKHFLRHSSLPFSLTIKGSKIRRKSGFMGHRSACLWALLWVFSFWYQRTGRSHQNRTFFTI